MISDKQFNAKPRSKFTSVFRFKAPPQLATATPRIQPTRKPAPEVPAKTPRILIVDDDPVVRMATELKLKAKGYAVSTAADGPTAIQTARTERPDLILLDLDFPPDVPITWDGFRILSWLRQLDTTKQTPVVILTGKRERHITQRAHAAGAAGLFQKPANYDALLALIELRLKSRPLPSPAPDSLHFDI